MKQILVIWVVLVGIVSGISLRYRPTPGSTPWYKEESDGSEMAKEQETNTDFSDNAEIGSLA